MNYSESLEYIYNAKQAGAEKHSLDNITELLKRLGNPEKRFPAVHVAGTNGKGSVCAFIESIIRAAGYKTGLFTSPYLERFTERIRIGKEEIPKGGFAVLATMVRDASACMVREGLTHPTFFELVTACCFLYFSTKAVDLAVVETGMGGRTDATNVLMPLVCAITTIGMDHTQSLGSTLELIATEKAGIIKPGIPCILSGANGLRATDIVQLEARRLEAKFISGAEYETRILYDGLEGQKFDLNGQGVELCGLEITLLGSHQLFNAVTAVLAVLELREQGFQITEADIRTGLGEARWPGRMELLRHEPPVLIDGAHNPQGAEALTVSVMKYFEGRPICLVMGLMADKEAGAIVKSFSKFASKVFATLPPSHERLRYSTSALVEMFMGNGVPATAVQDWRQAMSKAMESGMAVVVAGSLYLAGAARSWLLARGR
jgi:dihydrofolate synthase / folylpolyglutamate synthase